MPTLKITNNSAQNPITLDLSQYLKLADGGGVDPYDPQLNQRVFTRSLLKEGATLALTQYVERQLSFPVLLGPYANQSQMAQAIAQINQCLQTPGAVASWQDDGTSQPTYYDLVTGELAIDYSFRKAQKAYTAAKLMLFAQPFGRTAGSRPYAAASAVGPLLMISPYASGGALAIGASTQAGVAGFGGQQQGASSGVFYPGAPSLAGDAKALLQVSYVGPLPVGATNAGVVPYVAVALLPDGNYQPLATAGDFAVGPGASVAKSSGAVASQYVTGGALANYNLSFSPARTPSAPIPPLSWAGNHRLLAIARCSPPGVGYLETLGNSLVPISTIASVQTSDWGLYDLGCFVLKGSQAPHDKVMVAAVNGVDVTALVMLPDNRTWYLNPTVISASQYGVTPEQAPPGTPGAPFTNTLLIDDLLGDQFIYSGASQRSAPSPIGSVPSSSPITPYTRGLVPRLDPKDGLPPIAILGVARTTIPSQIYRMGNQAFAQGAASWSNQLMGETMAQVNVLERTRWILS